jgi:HAD superfamily hydrolase (TIGR01509 family)
MWPLLQLLLLTALASRGGARSSSAALLQLRGGGGLAYDAALFDFDGTLAQSEGLHRLAFSKVLGRTIEVEEWETRCVGTSPAKVMADHLPEGRLGPGETIDDLLVQRSRIFEQWIDQGKLEATGGAAELLADLREQGVRCAIVSSGSRSYILKALRHLGLDHHFELVIAGDDPLMLEEGSRHKPHPFPYLCAAKELRVAPERCVAFEDSLSGIRSAQAAGMLVIAVANAANAGLPVVPDEAPCDETGILPLMDRLADFDALDRRFLF